MKKLLMPDALPAITANEKKRITMTFSIRVGREVQELSYKTRLPQSEILDRLLGFALEHVELVPVDLYNLQLKEPEEDES